MSSRLISRRSFLSRSFSAIGSALAVDALTPVWAEDASAIFMATLKDLEAKSGGRLGVAVLDTRSAKILGYRMNERFAMCSTFKLLAAATLLAKFDAGKGVASRRVTITARELLPHSPTTKAHAGSGGITLQELCEAAVTESDNTAANLILAQVGGPPGVTAFARSLGDTSTRLDRIEPALNHVVPGDPRDTTTPTAMLQSLKTLALGTALTPGSREVLVGWLKACKTGDARLRAGLPADWKVGDKTGTNDNSANDIAVVWPPGRPPIVITVYLTEATALTDDGRDATVASVGRAVATLFKS